MGKIERKGIENDEVCIRSDTHLDRILTENGYINNCSLLVYLLLYPPMRSPYLGRIFQRV